MNDVMAMFDINQVCKRNACRRAIAVVVTSFALCAAAAAQDAIDPELLAAKSKDKASAARVVMLDGASPQAATLLATPLLSYADNPRGIHDARLWLYQAGQRPAALMKTEYMTLNGRERWVYCAASLSNSRMTLTLPSGREWTSSKPGVEWKALPTDLQPGNTPAARLRQLKNAARRFAATSFDDMSAAGAQEMRLLNQPLHRYAAPDEGVVDAALFGLTNNGTNPDLVLAVEIVRDGSEQAEWRFAASQMTSARLQLRLDDQEVWTAPYVRTNPGRMHDQERWMFVAEFSETQGASAPDRPTKSQPQ